jgi:hypothetical protein
MDTDTTPVEKKGISRRAVIAGGAIGGAAFWTVPVIDSITQRAAAASGCLPVVLTGVSYVYVVYTDGTTTWSTGFTAGCANQGANQGITQTAGPCSNGVTYSMTSPSTDVVASPGGTTTHLDASAATAYLTCAGGKVTPASGIQILAYFWFTGVGNGGPGKTCTTTPGGTPICVTFG